MATLKGLLSAFGNYTPVNYSTGFEIQDLHETRHLLDSLTWRIGQQPGLSHLGTVRDFRKKFKEYTKAEFREMGENPVVKDILKGLSKLNKDEIANRIKEHLV
jgi:hypothetical protein